MNFANLISLLAKDANGATGLLNATWKTYMNIVNVVMPVVIAVVISFGLVYGIILGVQFAKAEDTEQRDKAKQRLINLVIGIVVAAVILAIVYVVLASDWIYSFFRNKGTGKDPAGFLAMIR